MRKPCTKYSFFILLGLAAVAGAQQTIPPFQTPYGNFTTGIELGGSFGTGLQCIISTGTGAHWATCTTAGVSSITGPGGTETGALTFNGPGVTNIGTTFTFALGINQLTGDATAGPGSGSQAITFATVNSGPGACGDSTHVCQVTTNGKGLVTAQGQVGIAASGINQLTGDATAGPGTGSQPITFATVNSGPGACGDSTHVCQVTTNGKGLVTAQTAVAIGASSTQTASLISNDGSSGSRQLDQVTNPESTPPDGAHTYQNTSGARMLVTVSADGGGGGFHGVVYCDSSSSPTTIVSRFGRVNSGSSNPNYYPAAVSFFVPVNYYYGVSVTSGGGTPVGANALDAWTEWTF